MRKDARTCAHSHRDINTDTPPCLGRAQWRTIKFPLETVRPFIFESVALAEVRPELDPEKPEVGGVPVSFLFLSCVFFCFMCLVMQPELDSEKPEAGGCNIFCSQVFPCAWVVLGLGGGGVCAWGWRE